MQAIVDELKGEKIDIVPWNAAQPLFVAGALSPAKVTRVEIDEETKTALVIVPDNQLSLAIGREGQNARLAAKLTGWRIDIKSETQIKEIEAKKLFVDLPEDQGGAPAEPPAAEPVAADATAEPAQAAVAEAPDSDIAEPSEPVAEEAGQPAAEALVSATPNGAPAPDDEQVEEEAPAGELVETERDG